MRIFQVNCQFAVVENLDHFPLGLLVASNVGNLITVYSPFISRNDNSQYKVIENIPYTEITKQDGTGFTNVTNCVNYLNTALSPCVKTDQNPIKTEVITVQNDGQTQFTLTETPIFPEKSLCKYEHCAQYFGEFYTFTGNQMNIIGAIPFPICAGDKIFIRYNF